MRYFPGFTAVILIAAAGQATPQNYPSRLVRIVVPNLPSSGPDIVARMITPDLSTRLGQQVVVDNRPGASNMMGSEFVARSAPDGYTLLMAAINLTINPAVYKKVSHDAVKDFAPVTQAVSLPLALVVHPSLRVTSVSELIALGKARPGQINYASAGVGTISHVSMGLFLSMAKLDMIHVPYKGAVQGAVDLMAGHVSVMTMNILSAIPHIQSGRLRVLGASSSRRAAGVPGIPTVAEAGLPGYDASMWFGLLAPAGTSKEVITRLHHDVAAILRTPYIKEKLAKDGADVVASSPEEFSAYIRAETVKWAKVVKIVGIQPE